MLDRMLDRVRIESMELLRRSVPPPDRPRRAQLVEANLARFFGDRVHTSGELTQFLQSWSDLPISCKGGSKPHRPANPSQLWHANRLGYFDKVYTRDELKEFGTANEGGSK